MFVFVITPNATTANNLGSCSKNGYTVISINGMLTTSSGAVYNRDAIFNVLGIESYKGQEIFVDYVYNPTHGFFSDFVDAMIQKTGEKMYMSDTHDLKNMIVDLSKKVKTQKLLLVAHSQGNFYANDIYRTLGDKEGGISKSSMGIYGVGTPTSYIAGGGKYILSKNDSIINKIRLFGMIEVLPANVDIPKDEEDELNGHGLADTYLKYENKRISAEIMTMLHGLKEDPAQDPTKICIDTPKITILDETIDLVYQILDPIQETATGAVGLFVDNIVEPTIGTLAKIGRGYMKFVNNLFATSGTSFSQAVDNSINEKYDGEEYFWEEEDSWNEGGSEMVNEQEGSGPLLTYSDNKELEVLKNELTPETVRDQEERISLRPHSYGSSHSGQENTNSEDNNEEDNDGDDVVIDPDDDETTDPRDTDTDNDDDNVEVDPDENDEEGESDSDEEINNPPVVPGDIVPPVIFLSGEENIRISNGSDYFEAGATANDFVDGAVEVVITGSVDTTTNGIYTITYKAVDKAGNQAIKERKVEIYTPLPGFFVDEDTELPAGEYFFDNVTITNNATLTLLSDVDSPTSSFRGVKINATNLTVDSGSTISSDNQGFIVGPGTMTENRSGGSYGGKGDTAEESYVYGSAIYPKDLGSGGAIQREYHKGGGAIWLEISDTITNNGIISANGGQSSSGGSVYVDTKNLEIGRAHV